MRCPSIQRPRVSGFGFRVVVCTLAWTESSKTWFRFGVKGLGFRVLWQKGFRATTEEKEEEGQKSQEGWGETIFLLS